MFLHIVLVLFSFMSHSNFCGGEILDPDTTQSPLLSENANELIHDECCPERSYLDATKEKLVFDLGNVNGRFQVKYKPESFFAKNFNLLNSNNPSDKVIFNRSTFDFNLYLGYGHEFWDHDVTEFFGTLRHKVIWGNPETSSQTSRVAIKILDSVLGAHQHADRKQFLWIRELWFRFDINNVFNINCEKNHTFTLGSFPFELGRGISLGAAYAVNPGNLGFYSDNTIDQYAYGFLFSGQVLNPDVTYDLYGAVLENFSDKLRNTAENIFGQAYGRRFNQERGFGKVDFLIAGRLRWMPLHESDCSVIIEPYILYNNVPEQRVEFKGDASAQLGTIGLAGEFVSGPLEWGFDTSVNLGSQKVKGWDRNEITLNSDSATGNVTEVNSQVVTEDPNVNPNAPKAPKTSANQAIINRSAQDQSQNGRRIVAGVDLWNSLVRFRDPYRNAFKGAMFVADWAWNYCGGDVKLGGTIGIARGDENPNKDLNDVNDSNVDGDYKGFIGLQEIYSGKRVRSAFLLGGAGRIPRPLTTPANDTLDTIPETVSGFSNLIFVGGSLTFQPSAWDRYVNIMPNILAYWQAHHTKKFDVMTKMTVPDEFASRYLGLEMNIFADIELLKDFKFFVVSSVFVPGGHFRDIKGKPLNRAQQKILDRFDVTGIDTDLLPLLGDDTAFTINLGLEARF